MQLVRLSAVVHQEGDLFVSWTPELDVASQGPSVETAIENLREAVELYLEDADAPAPSGPPIITTIDVDGPAPSRLRD